MTSTMIDTTSFFFMTAFFCYVIVTIYFIRSLLASVNILHVNNVHTHASTDLKKFRVNRSTTFSLLGIGFFCHAFTLYPSLVLGNGAINFNLFNVLSLNALLMLGFSLLFSSYRPIIVLNLLAAMVAFVGLVLGYSNSQPATVTNVTVLSFSMELHIFFSIAAYSVLLMAAMQAILLRLQNRELKHITKTRVWVKLLPALQTMESLLFDMILLGFILLTLALGFGWVGVTDLFAQHLAHKTVFSVLAWVLFAWLIFGHWKFGWRGKLAANMTLWGFGFLALGFVGTKFVLEMLLS